MPLADSLGAFDALAKAGKIRAIGLSQFTAPRLQEALDTAAANGLLKPCCLQTWYNWSSARSSRASCATPRSRTGSASFLFTASPTASSPASTATRKTSTKARVACATSRYLEGKGPRVLEALDEIAAATGAALATVALAWTMAQPGITAALASATSVEQLKQLTAAMHLALTPDQIARLDAASAEAVPATA